MRGAGRDEVEMRATVISILIVLFAVEIIAEERVQFTNTYNPRVFSYSLSKVESDLFSTLVNSSQEQYREMLKLDPKLCAVARYNSLRLARKGEVPRRIETTAMRPLLWAYGVYDFLYLPTAFVYRSEEGLKDLIKGFLITIAKREFFNCGVGVADFKEEKKIATIVCSKQVIEATDLPKIMNEGSYLRLKFKIVEGYKDPLVYISPPSGSVKKVVPAVGENGKFTYSYELSGGEGKYLVQIIVRGKNGVEPVFLIPIYVSVSPAEIEKELTSYINMEDNTKHVSTDVARQMLFKAINFERRKINLPPLKMNLSLEKIAYSKAKAMAERQFFGHKVENFEIEKLMRSKNISFYKVAENIGLNSSPRMAHFLFTLSPAHRANILSSIFTEVGIGIYKVGDEDPQWYICEIFLMPKEM